MPNEYIYDQLAQNQINPEQEAQKMGDYYRQVESMTGGVGTTAPQAYAGAPATPSSGFRFPTPSLANLYSRVGPGIQSFLRSLGGGAKKGVDIIKSLNPFGQPGRITQGFMNYNPQLYKDVGNYNRGLDVGVGANTPLYAPRDLQVADVRRGGFNTGWGNTIQFVDPQTQEKFRFSHLNQIPSQLSFGDIVRKGSSFGLSGATGRVTAPHLDIEYMRGKQLADISKYYPEWFR